jgi:cell division transport system permease protein
MKINNIGYLIKEGIRGIFLHGFMSFAAVCVTVACLLIVGTFASVVYNANIIVEDLNKTSEIKVIVDESLSEAEALSVGTQINLIQNVYKATFVSKEEALQQYAENFENPELILDGIVPEDLRHRFVVILEDNSKIQQTKEDIMAISGVAEIVSADEMARFFSTVQTILQVVSIAVIAVLLGVSLLIISNTVKIGMHERRDEIAIMKMVGATNGFIRLPFVVEGFILGMVGASIAFCAEWLMYDATVRWLSAEDNLLGVLNFVPFSELLTPMVLTFGAAGLFVGIIGSWTSIRKFMNV